MQIHCPLDWPVRQVVQGDVQWSIQFANQAETVSRKVIDWVGSHALVLIAAGQHRIVVRERERAIKGKINSCRWSANVGV